MATTTLQQAITAIKLGNKETGKRILTKILQDNYKNETEWKFVQSPNLCACSLIVGRNTSYELLATSCERSNINKVLMK